MKRLIPILSLAALITACNSTPNDQLPQQSAFTQQAQVNNLDTAGLAQYHQWKAQNELETVKEENNIQAVQSAPKRQPVQARQAVAKAPVRKQATAPAPVSTPPISAPSSGSGEIESGGLGDVIPAEGTGEVAQEKKKEGVSGAVKGAVIGGVAGGAAGAVINKKNRVVGGIIGGVIGAAVGYGVGKAKDKKAGY